MDNDEIKTLKTHVVQQKALLEQTVADLKLNKQFIEKLQKSQANHAQAKEIILSVSAGMRLQIKGLLEHLVTMAIHAIFDDTIGFVVNINEEKSEVDFSLLKGGQPHPIIDFVGEGLVDVISFALRVSILLLSRRPKVLVLDEPFRFLNKARHAAAGELISRLSKDLGIQFVIVTHSDDLMEGADKIFQVELKNKGKHKFSMVTERGIM